MNFSQSFNMLADLPLLSRAIAYILPLLFAFTISAGAKAYAAYWCGDRAIKASGRLTFHPLPHIDWLGTIALPLLTILAPSPIMLGWTKPLSINSYAFKNPRRDIALVSAATPIAHFVMALIWMFLYLLSPKMGGNAQAIESMGVVGIMINISFMIFTLIPLPPMDGGIILLSLLPPKLANELAKVQPYTFWILIFLMLSGVFKYVFFPFFTVFLVLIQSMVSIFVG